MAEDKPGGNLVAHQEAHLLKGVHFYRPRGSRPRFSRLALQAWLEERDLAEVKEDIPMSRGYKQGKIRLAAHDSN